MADATFWVGQDGNIYYGSGQEGASVQNLGAVDGSNGGQYLIGNGGLYDRYTDSGTPALTYAATQIADPSAPQQTSSTTTGGATAPKVFNQAGANATQLSIDQIAPLLQAALATEGTRYQNAKNDFNTQEQTQRGQYDTATTTNQQNYDANFMDSIRAGIHGLGGLMALLRGTGAAGGTAENLARDTVGGVTAQDIRGGADTQKENQGQLDSSLSTFLTDLQRKRQLADDTRVNNERAVRRDSDTELQKLFGTMAGYYGDVGNQTEANNWINRGSALTPNIAANSQTQLSNYDTTPVVAKAPELTAFAGPTQPSVTTAPGGQVGSGIFTMTDPRRKREQSAPIPVGA